MSSREEPKNLTNDAKEDVVGVVELGDMGKDLGFEEKLQKLEDLTLELESGDLSLNEATKKFAEAKLLGDELQKMLGVAKLKVEEELAETGEEEQR